MDWVNGMAACRRMERALEQLVEQVKKDVELANELEYTKNAGWSFEAKDVVHGGVQVVCKYRGMDTPVAFFGRQHNPHDGIEVLIGPPNLPDKPPEQVFVSQEWNAERGTCGLFVDGKPIELWQISQRALARFVFPAVPGVA